MTKNTEPINKDHVCYVLYEWKNRALHDRERYSLPIVRDGKMIGSLHPLTKDSIDDPEQIRLLAEFREKANPFFPSQFQVTLEGTRRWCDKLLYQVEDRILFWVETDEGGRSGRGERVGHIGLYRFDWEKRACEIDNIVRGKEDAAPGIISDAIRAMLHWSFEELEMETSYLRVVSDNPRAIRMYEKLGYREIQRVPLRRIEEDNGNIHWDEVRDEPYLEISRYFVTMLLERNNLT